MDTQRDAENPNPVAASGVDQAFMAVRRAHVRNPELREPMKQPNRLARWIFRLGVAVCVLIVVATVASSWLGPYVWAGRCMFHVTRGAVYMYSFSRESGAPYRLGLGRVIPGIVLWPKKHEVVSSAGPLGLTIRVCPMWMFLLAALIPTMLAWRRLRRPLPGHCRKCGYNLTGNVTGRCSECGTEISTKENDADRSVG